MISSISSLTSIDGQHISAAGACPTAPKVLLVVAHPDDEYTFAATVYRISMELGGYVDQVVVTNGEAGYHYSQLAETFYGERLSEDKIGRLRLPEIRKRETIAAGRILGIRHHYFLDQQDTRYTLDVEEPLRVWNRSAIVSYLGELLARENYSFVFTLLPLPTTHGHHKAATLLALDAVKQRPVSARPIVLGGDPERSTTPLQQYEALPAYPETAPLPSVPVFRFERTTKLGYKGALSYQIVVNWVIAEHKSQGLFQTDYNLHDEERFWILDSMTPSALEKTSQLFMLLTDQQHTRGSVAKVE
jgi:LmbE family N-acetylglucosaminyl deacetylase